MSGATEPAKSFTRRDHLLKVEEELRNRWEASKIFEVDAPDNSDNKLEPKFMATFPYPYMNGRLHLGHAFSLTKADFAIGYQRLKGKRALFPFAFHCTGMPIQAAANKLKREIENGDHLAVIQRYENPTPVEEVEEEVPAGETPAEGVEKEKIPGKFTGKKSKAVAKGAAGMYIYARLSSSFEMRSWFYLYTLSRHPNDSIRNYAQERYSCGRNSQLSRP